MIQEDWITPIFSLKSIAYLAYEFNILNKKIKISKKKKGKVLFKARSEKKGFSEKKRISTTQKKEFYFDKKGFTFLKKWTEKKKKKWFLPSWGNQILMKKRNFTT